MPSIADICSSTKYLVTATVGSHVESGALLVSGDMAEHAVDHGPDRLQRRPAAAEAGLHGLHLGHGQPMASARGQVGDHAFEQGFELAQGHAHQRDAALVEEQLPVPDSVARDQDPAGRDGHVIEPERGLPLERRPIGVHRSIDTPGSLRSTTTTTTSSLTVSRA